MADLLSLLNQRQGEEWLVGFSNREFCDRLQQTQQKLKAWQANHPQARATILLAERDPIQFLASFLATCLQESHLVLGNPDWGDREWEQVFEQIQPDFIWGGRETRSQASTVQNSSCNRTSLDHAKHPLILIPTGGSSGKLRFAVHRWETLMASVMGFRQYFEVSQIHSLCVLPLYHVSGLMQFLRSLTTGGKFAVFPFKALASGELPDINPEDFFLSLVPTQLQKLLQIPSGRFAKRPYELMSFKTILLGGAPAWTELLESARRLGMPLAPTYGMTETASQIVTLKPEDFLAGNPSCGRVLPHARVGILSETGETLAPNQTGRITLQATSLMADYYPAGSGATQGFEVTGQFQENAIFQTDDVGYFDANGFLYLVGRHSDKIITGGENVFPAEVEAAIRATGLVQDVAVMGVGDRTWGEAIAAIYVPVQPNAAAALKASLEGRLSRFKIPKRWIEVDHLPRNAQGKLNRQQVRQLITPESSLECPTEPPSSP